jgi:tetratricopeptide (TPR) repeat protein
MVKVPNSATLYELLGQVYMSQKNYPKSEEAYRKAISLSPNSMSAYIRMGGLYAIQQSLDRAIVEFEQALKTDPKAAHNHVLLGIIYQMKKNTQMAIDHYRAALKLDPGQAIAANNLAWEISESGGSLDEALALAKRARERQPADTDIGDTLAWIYYKRGAYMLAIQLLEECVKENPENASYCYHLGMSYSKSGNRAKAREFLGKAIKLDPAIGKMAEVKGIMTPH